MLTEEQKTLIRAALDGKQMQRQKIDRPDWDNTGAETAIASVANGNHARIRIAPQPRVLHCSVHHDGIATHSDKLHASMVGGKYARIEIAEDGTITGKVEL